MIIGVFVSIFILQRCSNSKKDNIKNREADVELVKSWNKSDTTFTLNQYKAKKEQGTRQLYYNWQQAKYYKTEELNRAADNYWYNVENMEKYAAKKDTAKLKQDKKNAAEQYERAKDERDEAKEKFDKLNKMSFDEIKEMAVEDSQRSLKFAKKEAGRYKKWAIFFICLIPLYIFAARPYGYTVNKNLSQQKKMNFIKSLGLLLAGGFTGMAASLHFTTIVTTYRSGRKEYGDDGTGPAIIAMKVGLFIAAIFILCFTSCFLMLYATIVGLIQNYDWKEIFNKSKALAENAKKK